MPVVAEFLANNRIKVIASLPCYTESNVDIQRGNGVFQKSIKGLKLLNIDLNSSDEEKLFEMIDGNNDGRVRYNEFAVFVNGTRL